MSGVKIKTELVVGLIVALAPVVAAVFNLVIKFLPEPKNTKQPTIQFITNNSQQYVSNVNNFNSPMSSSARDVPLTYATKQRTPDIMPIHGTLYLFNKKGVQSEGIPIDGTLSLSGVRRYHEKRSHKGNSTKDF